MSEILKFDLPKNQSSIIKVIGVGGGGSNAVNHMYRQGITGVDFIICNTDAQSMESSPVPTRIQLGATLTDGLGAGASPIVGRNAALENESDIRQVLEKNTKMLFITAGLGGGTGTGAAPVIAEISRKLGILTVGIVTIPFSFEGRKRRLSADEGIRQMKQNVDALLIISNDKLRLLCGDLPLSEAFKRADNVLTTAAKGIAEIITVAGYINVDFEDVKTVMRNSGVAIMGTGIASGEERARLAVEEALNSPLLDNNDINGAGNILLYISSGNMEITMDEVTQITDYIHEKTHATGDIIWGNGFDESLGDSISVTIIATGFDEEHQQKDPNKPIDVKVRGLYDEEQNAKTEKRMLAAEQEIPVAPPAPAYHVLRPDNPEPEDLLPEPQAVAYQIEPENEIADSSRTFEFVVDQTEPEIVAETHETIIHNFNPDDTGDNLPERIVSEGQTITRPKPSPDPEISDYQLKKLGERKLRLRELSEKLKNHVPIEQNLHELESKPAYLRRNVDLADVAPSSETHIPSLTLSTDPENPVESKSSNPFFNPKAD